MDRTTRRVSSTCGSARRQHASLALVNLVFWFGFAIPAALHPQRAAAAAAVQTGGRAATCQAAGSAAKPAPETPAQAPAETSRSLFEPTWQQFEIGGRFSSVSGDPARFQRYEDIRDGILFTDARYAREHPDGTWLYRAAPTTSAGGINGSSATTSVRDASPFPACGTRFRSSTASIRKRRTRPPATRWCWTMRRSADPERTGESQRLRADRAAVRSPRAARHRQRELPRHAHPQIDLKATYTMQRHVGELPWGASFGFSNDVEVALPYDSRTNDFTLGAEWTNNRSMVSVAYNGSWFDNLDDTLVWDSPLRLDDSTPRRAGPRTHGAVAVEFGADDQRRRPHEVCRAAPS